MERTKKVKFPIGFILMSTDILLMGVCVLLWLIFLVMPNRYHYDYLGKVVKHHEGKFIVDDPETHQAVTYEDMTIYKTDDGVIDTAYYSSSKRFLRYDFAYDECGRNAWLYAYKYRWWTFHLMYLGGALLFFFLISAINMDWEWIFVLNFDVPNIKNGTDDGKIW